jgi:hypothetical protein
MVFHLNNYKNFSHRNSHNLIGFETTSDFIYITVESAVCKNAIHEYKKKTNVYIACPLLFKPLFTFIYKDMVFICSENNGLYCYKHNLNKLIDIPPLSLSFVFNDTLMCISDSSITKIAICDILKLPDENNECKATNRNLIKKETVAFQLKNGICSAYCIYNMRVFLGFENGSIGYISQNNSDYIEIVKLDESILTLSCLIDESNAINLYALTLESIFRIEIVNDQVISKPIYTNIKGRKIIIYKKYLILQQDNQITFLDLNLKVIHCTILHLLIKDIKLINSKLIIGFDCGLLNEYDLKNAVIE